MENILAVNLLQQVFGTRNPTYALDNVSFNMPATPSILNLVGESGSGKSTIARIILGLLHPTKGSVFYKDTDIFTKEPRWQKQFRREVQVVFQNPYSVYNPVYRVDRVLMKPIQKFKLASGKAVANEMILASLKAVDMRPEDVLGKYPHQLSGGQRQRLMLARLHLISAQLIIADEAISMIDAAGRVSFLNILLDFRDRLGISTLYITHDLSTAKYLGGEIIVLYKGRIVERGETKSVTGSPLHPYSQLLVQCVPVPNPKQRWKEPLTDSGELSVYRTPKRDRCLFAERCPKVMDICWNSRPPLQKPAASGPDARGEVACHLYQPHGN
ncbi:MAG: ATP-binding cassette domain-containing protein [Chloroflexi bacterium]|nr:ATP-binding cassette domain-containing protein [Chloroflexota bacterium]